MQHSPERRAALWRLLPQSTRYRVDSPALIGFRPQSLESPATSYLSSFSSFMGNLLPRKSQANLERGHSRPLDDFGQRNKLILSGKFDLCIHELPVILCADIKKITTAAGSP